MKVYIKNKKRSPSTAVSLASQTRLRHAGFNLFDREPVADDEKSTLSPPALCKAGSESSGRGDGGAVERGAAPDYWALSAQAAGRKIFLPQIGIQLQRLSKSIF